MVYDIKEERVNKVLKTGRKYLNWVQNSVLEGEITQAGFLRLKAELHKIIEEKYDSVIFYTLRTTQYYAKEILGKEKCDTDNII